MQRILPCVMIIFTSRDGNAIQNCVSVAGREDDHRTAIVDLRKNSSLHLIV